MILEQIANFHWRPINRIRTVQLLHEFGRVSTITRIRIFEQLETRTQPVYPNSMWMTWRADLYPIGREKFSGNRTNLVLWRGKRRTPTTGGTSKFKHLYSSSESRSNNKHHATRLIYITYHTKIDRLLLQLKLCPRNRSQLFRTESHRVVSNSRKLRTLFTMIAAVNDIYIYTLVNNNKTLAARWHEYVDFIGSRDTLSAETYNIGMTIKIATVSLA